jgi:hypothetical protein
MTHSALGEPAELTAGSNYDLLSEDWYQFLTPAQKIAYIRYQYISLNECVHDWDARAHVKRRPTWDGGKDNYGVKHTPVWGRILRAAETVHAHLGMWVHAHFSAAATEKIAHNNQRVTEMKPSMLYSANSPAVYRDYVAKMPEVIRNRFHVAAETMRLRFTTTAGYKLSRAKQNLFVICDESYVTATPFFRHAMAAKVNCESAVERYLWLAALNYESHQPAYDAVIEKSPEYRWWVENNIKSAVVAIRQHWREYDAE